MKRWKPGNNFGVHTHMLDTCSRQLCLCLNATFAGFVILAGTSVTCNSASRGPTIHEARSASPPMASSTKSTTQPVHAGPKTPSTTPSVASSDSTRTAAGPSRRRHRAEAFAQCAEKLKARLPHDGFTILVQEPFVVVGDEPLETVRRRAIHTIKWAVDRLKQAYFTDDPDEIISIWLFKDKVSYEQNTRRVFGETPHTPFGYYSPRHRALIMNIATGGGTLVHEIVHPFIAANFPSCPPWFNEGLGSLYEQCEDREGQIRGLTNWRLAGLQKAVRDTATVKFDLLMAMDAAEFYGDNQGIHYAQARYLCYYLQEKGLLENYYHQFRQHVEGDPTGAATLKQLLKTDDLRTFQADWERFVLELRFP